MKSDGFLFFRLLVRCSDERERIMNEQSILSIRCQPGNANHHLWNNNGTWWCHWTLHLPGFQKHRRRASLKTKDLREARQRRDSLLARFASAGQPSSQSLCATN